MKRQVRSGVFETNSSSMHSLVIIKKDEYYTPEEIIKDIYLKKDESNDNDERCVWELHDDNLYFGRSPFRSLNTFESKWCYACASLVKEYNDEVYLKLLDIAFKNVVGLKKIKMPLTHMSLPNKKSDKIHYTKAYTEKELIQYLEEKEKQWNIKSIDYWQDSLGWWCFYRPNTGYVDADILSGFLDSNNITLEDFILSKKYVVVVDGDEYCYWQDMKESGLINKNIIESEYPGGN